MDTNYLNVEDVLLNGPMIRIIGLSVFSAKTEKSK